jgi:outer membrane lipoprotein-sorting protein
MVIHRRLALQFLLSATVLALIPAPMRAQPKPGHLDEVLRQMDAASEKFQSAEANFRWDLYDHLVKETTTQTGTIYFKKQGAATVMGAKVTSPKVQIVEFRNGTLRLFEPATDHLTVVASKGGQSQMDSFLTLGFGASGKDLLKAWTISDLGDEVLDGVKTAKLDLVPKDPSVHNNCTHMTIWIDPARGISLKQSFYMPSDDYRTAVYSDIKYNQPVNETPYKIKTDGKTTTDQH